MARNIQLGRDYRNRSSTFFLTATDAEEAIRQDELDKQALKTYALVVKEKDSSSAAYNVALELQSYLSKMTGITYEIYSESELTLGYNRKCHYISIGENAILTQSPYKNLGGITAEEGYFVKNDGNIIIINGNSDRGTVYGAYAFLRALGCEFYASDCEKVPSGVTIEESAIDIMGEPDIAVRHYLSYKTCYNGVDLGFTAKIEANSSYAALTSAQGGRVEFGNIGGDTHNMHFYIPSSYRGTDYCPANADVDGGYVLCLTNGIEYNTSGVSTLSLVTESMTNLIRTSPFTEYFVFGQEDGEGYCTCTYCTAAANTYGRSGVLVRFCNKLLENLRADENLSARTFRIVTFAYSYTVVPPKGGVTVDKDLRIWYAEYSDMRYSLLSDNQQAISPRKDGTTVSYKENLQGWINLTSGENSGSIMLYLYDTSFNNYLAYYGTAPSAIDGIIDEANDLGVERIVVLGSYDADNMWQSVMRNYIWSRKMSDKSLKAKDLRADFIKNYFGEAAASYIQSYCEDYDGYYADNTKDYPVKSGNQYYLKVTVSEHCTSLKRVNDAISAVENSSSLTEAEKAVYLKRLYSVKASSYAMILYNYDDYYSKALTSSSNRELLGGSILTGSSTAKANFTAEFKTICENAGITRCREGTDENNTVENFIANNVGNAW